MEMLHSKQPTGPTEPPSGQYCATILDKERDVYGNSRVLGRACSDRSDDDALAQAQSTATTSGASVQYVTYIIGFAEHAGYAGRFQKVYGCCGDCDWAGYTINTYEVEFILALQSLLHRAPLWSLLLREVQKMDLVRTHGMGLSADSLKLVCGRLLQRRYLLRARLGLTAWGIIGRRGRA
jgi:hypothetical protein